jgi:hypothetical protein
MHSVAYGYVPPSFHDIWTLNQNRDINYELRNLDTLLSPTVHIELFRKIPVFSLSVVWNNLGEHNRYQCNKISFKIALTDLLFESTYYATTFVICCLETAGRFPNLYYLPICIVCLALLRFCCSQ